MKVPLSIRNIYYDQRSSNIKLKELVDTKISSLKKFRWHYESRIKSIESFALKLETGRINNVKALEDFFACTLVVENKGEIKKAEDIILNCFKMKSRKPHLDKKTHKYSDSFPFDDLRLYVEWKDALTLPPTGVEGTLFEVQIKTFLQHAWAIATHDLIYKSDSVSWAKERIAYQIKAMLEHAEISILEAEKLSESSALDKTNNQTEEILEVIRVIKDFWPEKLLPGNLVLLARNVLLLIECIKIDITRLRGILDMEDSEGRGSKTLNLSPYGAMVQSLFNNEKDKVLEFLIGDSRNFNRFKILIPNEIDLPDDVDKSLLINAVFV